VSELSHRIRNRRAIRRYEKRAIPRPLLDRLLEDAMWAPSAHNRQPWRFAVLTRQADIARLATAMGEKLRADRSADGDSPAAIERDVTRSYERLTGAPVIVLVCLSMVDMDSYPDSSRAQAERTMAVQSVAMAANNLWLLAHDAGLGACWLCAPLFVPELARTILSLPADWEPQGLLTLGWPAEKKEKSRSPWHSKVLFL